MKKGLMVYGGFIAIIWTYFIWFYPLDTLSDSRYAAYIHAFVFTKMLLPIVFLWCWFSSKKVSELTEQLEGSFQFSWIDSFLYGLFITASYQLVTLPVDLVGYWLSTNYGVSTHPFMDWMGEWLLEGSFFVVMVSILIVGVRLLIRKFQRLWWVVVWAIGIPIVLFLLLIQPSYIDPLFETFTPLQEGPLKDEIVEIAEEAGIPEGNIFEVNMSEKTSAYNAYVTGILSEKRIVLWDTTLTNMKQDEVLFILAHEIAHYVKHHVYWGIFGYLVLSFLILWTTSMIYHRLVGKSERGKASLHTIPILLLTVTILMFITQPISLYVSREMERSADRYAIEHTEELTPALESYRALAIQSKSDISPPAWIVWLRYTHPPIQERMNRIQDAELSR